MKCVVCQSPDIERKTVVEEIWINDDLVLAPLEVLVCAQCGERYYNRQAMRKLEEVEDGLRHERLALQPAGRVLKIVTAGLGT